MLTLLYPCSRPTIPSQQDLEHRNPAHAVSHCCPCARLQAALALRAALHARGWARPAGLFRITKARCALSAAQQSQHRVGVPSHLSWELQKCNKGLSCACWSSILRIQPFLTAMNAWNCSASSLPPCGVCLEYPFRRSKSVIAHTGPMGAPLPRWPTLQQTLGQTCWRRGSSWSTATRAASTMPSVLANSPTIWWVDLDLAGSYA